MTSNLQICLRLLPSACGALLGVGFGWFFRSDRSGSISNISASKVVPLAGLPLKWQEWSKRVSEADAAGLRRLLDEGIKGSDEEEAHHARSFILACWAKKFPQDLLDWFHGLSLEQAENLLCQVEKCLGKWNPERAFEGIRDWERRGKPLSPVDLAEFADSWAESDADGFVAKFAEIAALCHDKNKPIPGQASFKALEKLAESSPQKALSSYAKMIAIAPEVLELQWLPGKALERWLGEDQAAATVWVSSLQKGILKNAAQGHLFVWLARQSPDALLQEVSRSGFSGVSDDAYRKIIRRLAYFPEMTLRGAWELGQVWIQDVNAAEETKVYSRDGFAVNWEPSYLNDFANAFGAAHWRNPEKFVSRLKADLEGIPSEAKVGRGDIVREAFNGAARFWSESQSAEALAEALKLPPSLRSVGIQQILSSMVERSPQVALRLARAIPAEHRLDLDGPMQLAAELGDLSGFQLFGDAEWMVSGPLPVSPKLESYVKASGRFVDVYARKIPTPIPRAFRRRCNGWVALKMWILRCISPPSKCSALSGAFTMTRPQPHGFRPKQTPRCSTPLRGRLQNYWSEPTRSRLENADTEMKVSGRIHLFAVVPAFVVGWILAQRSGVETTHALPPTVSAASATGALRTEDGPLREFILNLKTSSGHDVVPETDSGHTLSLQELDALRIRYPDDDFFALEEVLHTSQAEPARFFAWMQRGQHWPPMRADSGGFFEGFFEAWRLKDEAGMASVLLEHPDAVLRAIGLRSLLVTKDRALLKRVLAGLFEADYNSSEFISIDPAVSLSLPEFLALAQEFPASPSRDQFVRRQIQSLLESISEPADPFGVGSSAKPDARLIETWRDLSEDLRAFAVEFGFFGWRECAKTDFPGLLELAKPVLLKATGDQQSDFDQKFWKTIGGAWARDSFPEALQWIQTSLPPGRQFRVERSVFREAFEAHPEAVLAAIAKLPSLLRQQECLHELRVSCPPPLRPRLEEFTAQVLPESRRSLMQRMAR